MHACAYQVVSRGVQSLSLHFLHGMELSKKLKEILRT